MKLLAIESSSLVASAAIADEETVLAEYTICHRITHSQSLLPMIDAVCQMTELDPASLDAVAVASGPGSFTGLRIGAATAKGLGMAWNKPLVAVPTLDAMAYSLWNAQGLVCPIMDARRSQVYTGLYRFAEEDSFEKLRGPEALSTEELLAVLKEREETVTFLGDGVPVFRKKIEEALGEKALFAPPHASRQRAAAVAALGLVLLRRGESVSAEAFAPSYLRVSQAERERARRLAAERKEHE